RSEAYFVFPLAQGTPGKQCGLAATGVYQPSLRSPWLAASAAQWKKRVRIIPRYYHPLPASVSKPVLDAVDNALYSQRKLEIEYRSLERIRNNEPAR
ncbi:hypothetical protein, partial [Thiolapillus sp.]|uniref:hypothetical protein n=1 Tax=Thiolapillus sp. TaxID=2017437 RepID=UPI003AF567C5